MFEVSFMMRGLLFLFHFMLFEDVCASILQSVCGVQQMTTQITRFCDFFKCSDLWIEKRKTTNGLFIRTMGCDSVPCGFS